MELRNLPWYGQLLVFLVIGGICCALFYYLHYSPTQDTIKSTIEKREKLEQEIRKAERAKEQREKIEEQLAANLKILEDLKGILPERKEISDILARIQNIVTNSRLRIMVFDPGKVKDTATYEHPHRYAEGIVEVIVNGQPVIHEGIHTGSRPGLVLNRKWK